MVCSVLEPVHLQLFSHVHSHVVRLIVAQSYSGLIMLQWFGASAVVLYVASDEGKGWLALTSLLISPSVDI